MAVMSPISQKPKSLSEVNGKNSKQRKADYASEQQHASGFGSIEADSRVVKPNSKIVLKRSNIQ